jgi:integrase
MVRYVYPALGSMPVATIDTPLVLKVVKPLWERVPTTAKRLLGRIENVLGWATVHHYRHGDNPAAWNGLIEHALPAVGRAGDGEHHKALPYADAPAFMASVRANTSIAARCLELITLTAVRLNEALNATWDEFDLDARVWTIPASRMGKTRRKHQVPLSDAALSVLKNMKKLRMNDWVFPGTRQGRPVGENSVWRLVKEVSGDETLTVHGLRSCFADWSAEKTNFQREVREAALAHTIPSAVEAAYRRGDLFEKRRKLMGSWAEYCAKPMTGGKVVAIRGRS